jgi:predicted Zn-dependent protease
MLGGSDDRAALLDRLDDGLWVTRLHYVNGMLEPRRAVMTGLTRDGLFRVQGGKPRHGVRNMRFNDSILEAFQRIDGLSAALLSVPTWWSSLGAVTVPSVLIRGLRFTGTSEE